MAHHDWRDFAARSRKTRNPGSFRKTRGDMVTEIDGDYKGMCEWCIDGCTTTRRTWRIADRMVCVHRGGYRLYGKFEIGTNVIVPL